MQQSQTGDVLEIVRKPQHTVGRSMLPLTLFDFVACKTRMCLHLHFVNEVALFWLAIALYRRLRDGNIGEY